MTRKLRSVSWGSLLVSALFAWWAYRGIQATLQGQWHSMVFSVTYVVIVILLCIRHRDNAANVPMTQQIGAWVGTLVPSFYQLPSTPTWSGWSFLFICVGGIVALAGVMSLGRSFGITPANRGIRQSGMYAYVRHPIYASYIPIHLGLISAYPSWWNIGLASLFFLTFVIRIYWEEQTLMNDPEYVAYAQRVPYRLLPFVF